jgi:hypothetical protein
MFAGALRASLFWAVPSGAATGWSGAEGAAMVPVSGGEAAAIVLPVVVAGGAADGAAAAIASAVRWARAIIEIIGLVPEAVGIALASPIQTPGVS